MKVSTRGGGGGGGGGGVQHFLLHIFPLEIRRQTS